MVSIVVTGPHRLVILKSSGNIFRKYEQPEAVRFTIGAIRPETRDDAGSQVPFFAQSEDRKDA